MVNNTTSSTAATTAASSLLTGKNQGLGKDDFLKLLVTQLQNQDPLNPQDPTEFTAQLAQFSSLEQLFSVNDNLAQMANNNQGLERLSAFSLIGRQVEVAGPDFEYQGSPVGFGYTLETPAEAVSVRILDAQNQVVAVLPNAAGTAGKHDYSWDGTGLSGQALPAGQYHLQVERQDANSSTAVDSRISSQVTGVELGDLGSVLTTGAGKFDLSAVLNVTGA